MTLAKNSNTVFFVCLSISVFLLVGGALTPPLFVIDGSMIQGCGILALFAAIWHIKDIKAKNTKIQAGENLSVEIEHRDQ